MRLPPAGAAAAGGELAFLRFGGKTTLGVTAAGGGPISTPLPPGRGQVTPFPLSPPTWSTDGQSLVFAGGRASEGRGSEFVKGTFGLYVVPTETGEAVLLPGTARAIYPVALPGEDAGAVLKFRGENSEETVAGTNGSKHVTRSREETSIWVVSLVGGPARQVTPWRAAFEDIPFSVSPDGRTLVATRAYVPSGGKGAGRRISQAMLLDLQSGRARPVGPNVVEASYSPDGSRLAMVVEHDFAHPHVHRSGSKTTTIYGQTDIYVEELATGAMTLVSVGPALDVDPSWDPSGQRLSFIRYGDVVASKGLEAALFGLGDTLYEVNADGTCPTAVLHESSAGFLGPSWRPGGERAAGPISC
jgi:Tol biopolymer transport system component